MQQFIAEVDTPDERLNTNETTLIVTEMTKKHCT